MRRFAEAMVALFQFLIGKVQHMARKLTKAEKDLFQFLIGKVQRKIIFRRIYNMLKDIANEFQFLIGKVQQIETTAQTSSESTVSIPHR